MSRSGYGDDCENVWLYRQAVDNAIGGKRGQKFFRDLIGALDAMPERSLIAHDFQRTEGEYCALGALAASRGIAIETLDPEEPESPARALDIAPCLAAETMFMNDEGAAPDELPWHRWQRVRDWAQRNLRTEIAR